MSTALVTAPTKEPISLAEAKLHLRLPVDFLDDDILVERLIQTARERAENITRRRYITQTWDYFLDDWPEEDYIEVPFPPLLSVTTVKYKDSDGTQTTWAATNYIVDIKAEPGRVVLADGISWPSDSLYPSNPIEVRFVCGYGAAPDTVPANIKSAMLLMVGELYERREEAIVGQGINQVELSTEALLYSYRIFGF